MLFDLKSVIYATIRLTIVNLAMWLAVWFLSFFWTAPALINIPLLISAVSVFAWGVVVSAAVDLKD